MPADATHVAYFALGDCALISAEGASFDVIVFMKVYKQLFPSRSLAVFAFGLVSLGVFAALALDSLGKNARPSGIFSVFDPENRDWIFMSLMMGLILLCHSGWDLIVLFRGPHRILIDEATFALNGKRHAFNDVRGFVYKGSAWASDLHILMRSGKNLKIRKALFEKFDDIRAELIFHTEDRLTNEARMKLVSGKSVSFGKGATLSPANLVIKRKSISFEEIKKARIFVVNESEKLIVELLNGERVKIEACLVENVNVLLRLVAHMSPNMRVGL